MKQILIKLTDGRLGYCRPGRPMKAGESEQDYLTNVGQETISKCTRDGQPGWNGAVVVAIVDENVVLSADRNFREGWDWTTPEMKMDYNIPKCREIAKKKLASEKHALVDSAQTIDELKAIR